MYTCNFKPSGTSGAFFVLFTVHLEKLCMLSCLWHTNKFEANIVFFIENIILCSFYVRIAFTTDNSLSPAISTFFCISQKASFPSMFVAVGTRAR